MVGLLILLSPLGWVQAEAQQTKSDNSHIEKSQSELVELQNQLSDIDGSVAHLHTQQSALESSIMSVEQQIALTESSMQTLTAIAEGLSAEAVVIKQRLQQAQDALRTRQEQLQRLVSGAVHFGELPVLKVLLNGDIRSEHQYSLTMLKQIADLQSEQIQSVRGLQAELLLNQQKNQELRQALLAQDDEIKARFTQLQEQQDARSAQLAELQVLLSKEDQRRHSLTQKISRLNKLVASLHEKAEQQRRIEARKRAEAAKPPPTPVQTPAKSKIAEAKNKSTSAPSIAANKPKQSKTASASKKQRAQVTTATGVLDSSLAGPVPTSIKPAKSGFAESRGKLGLPAVGDIVQRFGRDASGAVSHGVRIATEEGSPVFAIYDGQVIFSHWFKGFGQLLILDHGESYMSLYGHNQRLLVAQGDIVKGGEIIALAGTSGGLTDAQLYFEIRHNGDAKDPLKWCPL